ncbi:unnamed protein product [Rotaria sp. Silwood2]|nr:unnamed protein product [Rotaria sp. Silwood2]CAF4427603.1 unnamed protein product [Rotaria sp. Silwood2]
MSLKECLFARYTSAHVKGIDEDEDEDMIVVDERETTFTNFSKLDTLIDASFLVFVIKPYKSLEHLPSTIDQSDEFQMLPTMIRSSRSCSNLTSETTIRFDTNYAFTLDETKHQIETRKTIRSEPTTRSPMPTDKTPEIPSEPAKIAEVKENFEVTIDKKSAEASEDFKYFRKTNRSTVYGQAVATGPPYISSSRLQAARRSRKEVRFLERIDAIVAIASAPPRYPPLARRHSFHEAFFYERHHPHIIKQRYRERRPSIERDKQNFDPIIKTKYKYDQTRVKSAGKRILNEFEWTRDLWYSWLDEYIAEFDRLTKINEDEDEEDATKKVTAVSLEPITNLQLADSEEHRLIEEEIHRLTALINRDQRDVFSLTRCGALLRKLDLFHDALDDLSLAIYIEPSFMDAYWQRALIYMIFEHYDEALDSLNMSLKFNKTHAGAYKLRGDVYAIKNDLALAIANYSQAIRYNSTDHETYFQRT